jgi:hypothetical protein
MPRYNAQNLAAIDPEFRRKHQLDANAKANTRYTYGNRVLVATGNKIIGNGLCLRLLPVYEDGKSSFATLREGTDGFAVGDWCRLMTVAHWVGSPGICFIVDDGNPSNDPKENPYVLLYRAGWRAKTELQNNLGQLFAELMQSQSVMNSHVGSLRKPEKMLFVSATTVYADDNGNTVLGAFSEDQQKNARIIALKFTATQSLFSILRATDESGAYIIPDDDMMNIGNARLITVLPEAFRSNEQKVLGIGENGQETFFCPSYAKGSKNPYVVGYPAGDRRSAFTHFAFVHDTFNGKPVSLEKHAEEIVANAGTMDEHINVLSFDAQAKLIAGAFPREALLYAWEGFPQYLRHIEHAAAASASPVEVDTLPEDEEESPAPAASFSRAVGTPPVKKSVKPVPAPSPASTLEGEISAEEEADVAEMFSSAPPPKQEKKPAAGGLNANEILARAKARAAAKK